MIVFFLWPEHRFYSTLFTSLITVCCLVRAIKTLSAGEAAISYGGFANEIIRNDFKIRRIENPHKECIIQNDPAKELLKGSNVLSFLECHIAEGADNQAALYRLQTAVKNLSTEKVMLSLALKQNDNLIFNDLEYFEVSVRPMYLKKPKIFNGAFSVKRILRETYFYWTLHNITAKQNMDAVFKEECSSLHDFLDYMPVGLYTIDTNFHIGYVNHNLADFLGREPHRLLGASLQDFLTPDSLIPLKQDFWCGPVQFANAEHQTAETYVFQSSYREHNKMMLRGVVLNRLPTPDDLQHQINRARDDTNWLFNNSPIGIIFVDAQGKVVNYNPKAVEFFAQNEHGESSSNLLANLPEDSLKRLQNALSKVTQEDSGATSIELKTGDKTLNLFIKALHYLHQKPDATKAKFIIYVIDATKQKNLEAQFAQAQKMQAVGQLAGGVAHDFNNLLTAIIGFTDLLLQRHGVGDPSFADLIQIKQNANRATALVRQLLAFSRKQPLIPKLLDITDNFADLSQMLRRILGEKIKLVFNYERNLGYVKVDPNQFSQVIINLAVNAKDAMNGNGTLTISTGVYYLNEPYSFGDDTIAPGDFVVINVTDTGCGIPPENLTRIFDPFFSTKENIVGSGTGLGLAMVYGIVRQTEGFIKVDSIVGKGTTFSIYLPRFENAPEEELSTAPAPVISSHHGQPILQVQETRLTPSNINQKVMIGLNISNTIDRSNGTATPSGKPARILLVEDETSVRTFAVRALRKKGYDVVDSDSAENALEIIGQDQNFDLLLTDMVLPGLSGAQLTNKIKEILPKISVILASGYSEDIARQEVDNTLEFDFITKPYSLGDLTAKVFDVLNRKHE
jgi:two-component system cell cycle sensor histidine kinase/response regulator CckA